MAERRANKAAKLSRRDVLAPILGLAALPMITGRLYAETYDNPPVFRTTRRQFTIIEPSKALPQLSLTGLDGKAVRIGPMPGKVLLINIWATWRDACRLELPMLERLYQSLRGRVGIAAVSTEKKDRSELADYLARLSIRSLPIYLDPAERLASSSSSSDAPLAVYGMPVSYVVTPSGKIAGFIEGAADWASAEGQRLLAYYAQA